MPTELVVDPSAALITFEHGLEGEVDVHGVKADGSRGGVEYVIELDENTVEVCVIPGVPVKLVADLSAEPAPEERPGNWRTASDDEKFMASMSRMPPPPQAVY